MKKLSSLIKIYKFDLILLLLLMLLTYKAWDLLPQFTIRSDGFLSMIPNNQKMFWNGPTPFASIVLSEMIFGFVFSKMFGVNLGLYYWAEILVLFVIAIELYITFKYISKKYVVSFSIALISSVSYFGVYDMVSTHCYCFFLERVIPVLFLIPSFLFLHLFLEKKKKKYFIFSLLLYFLGMGLGHFAVLFTPPYFLYPFFWKLINEKNFRKRVEGFWYGISFVAISVFFILIQQINESGIAPHKWTFTEFLLHPQEFQYFEKIALQFVYWSQYPVFLQNLTRNPMASIIDYRIAGSYIPHVSALYAIASICIYKFLPKQRPMFLTTAVGIPTIFFLNAYIGQYDMIHFTGASRYLYYPTFLLAIFWSYFLWAIFWRKKNILILGGLLILYAFYAINNWVTNSNSFSAIQWNNSSREIMNYVISSSQKLPQHTLVVVAYPEFGIQEASFFTAHVGKSKVSYTTDNNLVNPITWEKAASISAHVIKLKYDEKCKCVRSEKIK